MRLTEFVMNMSYLLKLFTYFVSLNVINKVKIHNFDCTGAKKKLSKGVSDLINICINLRQ